MPTHTRTFGAEFEIVAPVSMERMRDIMARHGLPVVLAQYSGREYSRWQIKPDCSISGYGTSMEIVSPVLTWPEAQNQFARLEAAFAEVGGVRVNESCGGHVHVHMGGLDAAQVATVVDTYLNRQRLHTLLAGRAPAGYASALPRRIGRDWLRDWQQGRNPYYNRGSVINPGHYLSRGTLEFRQGAGRTSPAVMLAWIGVLLALVEGVATDTLPRLRHGSTSDDYLASLVAADLIAPGVAEWMRGNVTATTLTERYYPTHAQAASTVRDSLPNLFRLQGIS